MTRPGIKIYLEKKAIAEDKSKAWLALYGAIENIARGNDIEFEYVERTKFFLHATPDELADHCNDGNLHIVDDGFLKAPNLLNAGLAYLNGYWHLDPNGIRYFSSIANVPYDESAVKFQKAKVFFEELRDNFVKHRSSRYAQPEEHIVLPLRNVAVFFQGRFPLKRYKCTTFTDIEMLQAVIDGTTDEPICVKLHPRDRPLEDLLAIAEVRAQYPRVHLVDANVHDMIAAADVVVSINSSVSIEGFMHRKPAIHFGTTDLVQHSQVVEKAEDFPAALARARQTTGGYAQYLYWYFKENCIETGHRWQNNQIWKKFADVGFPRSRFGMTPGNNEGLGQAGSGE